MKIAIIADARSEHTRRWVRYFANQDQVLLLSSFPYHEPIPGVELKNLPKLFSAGNAIARSKQQENSRKSLFSRLISAMIAHTPQVWYLWQHINFLDSWLQGVSARKALAEFRPDFVHAMRIQNEGYVGALTRHHPLIISAMGNDFVYTAKNFIFHRLLTKLTVPRCDGFMADCGRDLRLAQQFGLKESVPIAFFLSNGGVDFSIFSPGLPAKDRRPCLLYFRGISPLYRPQTLLKAFGTLLHTGQFGNFYLQILAPLSSLPWFEGLRQQYVIPAANFKTQGFASPLELAQLLKEAAIVVSPSISDGSPNSMIESMACGAFPVISNLESTREWIQSGKNGFLFDPENPEELASCLTRALCDLELRNQAQKENYALVQEKADYAKAMPRVRQFYKSFVCP